jgi:hypothetical protein
MPMDRSHPDRLVDPLVVGDRFDPGISTFPTTSATATCQHRIRRDLASAPAGQPSERADADIGPSEDQSGALGKFPCQTRLTRFLDTSIVPHRPTGRAFDDVRRDRDGCPPDLCLQPEALLGQKTSGRALDTLEPIVCHGEDLELRWISTHAPALYREA